MVRWIDSFDSYAIGDIGSKYDGVPVSGGITTPSRFGNAWEFNANNTSRQAIKILDAQPIWIPGFAFYIEASGATAWPFDFVNVQDGANQVQVGLRLDANFRVGAYRNGTLIGGHTGQILAIGIWYFMEVKFVISDTVGVVELRIDEAVDFNLTSVDTRAFGATADRVQIRGQGGTASPNASWHADDYRILDGQVGAGSNPCNDFLGDCRVESTFPNGNGNASAFDGSDGNQINNFQLVDEIAPDDDTTYVESPDVGDKDTYTHTDLSTTQGTIYAVQQNPYARKTDAGARQIVSVARVGATEVDSPAKTLSTTYRYLPDVRETKPGGGDWTIPDVNNAEFGAKVLT